MAPEGSLPSTQGPPTCSYPEPVQSCPHLSSYFNTHFNTVTHLRIGLTRGLVPWGLPTKTRYAPLTFSHTHQLDHPSNTWYGASSVPPLPYVRNIFIYNRIILTVIIREKYPQIKEETFANERHMYSLHLEIQSHCWNIQSLLQNGICTLQLVYALSTRFQFTHFNVSINFSASNNIKTDNRFLLEYIRTY
jgi:hypothetical protein